MADVGAYPHKAIQAVRTPRPKKAPTAITLTCRCGCKVRMSVKFLTEPGPPRCGCGKVMTAAETEGDDE